MKTKRLILKLFLAVCFFMAVPPREAEAALTNTLDIGNGDITVSPSNGGNDAQITQGSNPAESLSSDAYTITGESKAFTKIDITGPFDVNGNDSLHLTLNKIDATRGGIQLNITNAKVYITVIGETNTLKGTTGNVNAVNLTNANLYFSGTDSCITISGATNSAGISAAVHADNNSRLTIESGRVVLIAGDNNQNIPFQGGALTINGGILDCYRGENFTAYGNGFLTQNGGMVRADGLASIDFDKEQVVGLKHDNYTFALRNSSSGGIVGDTPIGKLPNASSGIPIPDSGWNTKYLVITPDTTAGNSVKHILYIPERPASAPSGFRAKNESISGAWDGQIIGVNDTMQYAIDKGSLKTDYQPSDWHNPGEDGTRLEGSTLMGLKPGKYRLRYKPVDNSNVNPLTSRLASLPSTTAVTIEPGDLLKASLSHTFDSRDYNDTNMPPAAGIHIENSDRRDSVTINRIETDNEKAFEIIDGSLTIPKESSDDSWTIRPKAGLDAGEYKAGITIYYTKDNSSNQGSITIEDAVKFTVNKLSYAGDPLTVAPELDSNTFDSITLKPIVIEGSDKEYKFNYSNDGGKTWQDDLTFKDLEANKKYSFVARYAATTNYEASVAGPQAEFSTEKKVTIVYRDKQLSMIPKRNYKIYISGNDTDYTDCVANKTDSSGVQSLLDIKNDWFGKTLEIHDSDKNTIQELAIPDIGKAPTSPKGQAESFSSAGDGKILGVTTSMEYKLKGSDDDWVTCPAKTIENLAAGTYLVRTKAVDEGTGENKKYTFASQATEVVVARGNALNISPETFDLGKAPYKTTPTAKAIAFRNHDKVEDITIKSIALSDDSPFTIVHKDTDSVIVPAGKNNETFKIQPKADLNVGTYTDEFVVTFEVGYNPDTSTGENGTPVQAQSEGFNTDSPDTSGEKSAAIPVTFTVEKGVQDPPPVPTEKTVKSTSITLETIPNNPASGAKAQYSKDGGKTWQDSPTFNRLKADTEYYFVSRYAATDNYNESEISNGENAITTAEEGADDTNNSGSNATLNPAANGSNNSGSSGSNGSSGTGSNGTTNGSNNSGGTGSNGTTNGSNSSNGTDTNGTSSGLTAAKTGDMNNIQLWIALMIGSYLSCYLIIKDRLKKARAK